MVPKQYASFHPSFGKEINMHRKLPRSEYSKTSTVVKYRIWISWVLKNLLNYTELLNIKLAHNFIENNKW